MNILNRRMFAAGDVVNQPLIDVTTEIANLSRSGLAPVQILEKLQSDYARMGVPYPRDLGFATIERIAREVGGPLTIINPDADLDAISTQANTLQNIVPPVTGGFFTPDKTLPNQILPDFSEDIQAIGGDSITSNVRPTEQALQPNLILPDMSGFDVTEVDDDLPKVNEEKLDPNSIKLSDGRIIPFEQGIKNIQDGKSMDVRLYRIFNAEGYGIELGENVKKALEGFIARDEPGLNRLFSGYPYEPSASERRGGFFAPEDIGSSFYQLLRKSRDALMEGGERIAGGLDFILGEEQAGQIQDFFEGDRFSESPGYFERGGMTKEEIDRMVLLEAGLDPDDISTGLENLESEKKSSGKNGDTEDTGTGEEDTGTGEEDTGTGEEDTGTGEGDTGTGEGDTAAGEGDIPEQSRFAQFVSSPDFIRYVRNVGKGLAQTGEFASGVTLGAAAAAEEKAAGQKRDPVKVSDQKSIRAVSVEMNQSVQDYNNALAAEKMAQSVIDLANGNEDLATFGAKLGASVDDILAAANLKDLNDFNDLSDTAKARIALTELTNRNIKEILGESGRTISNIDRDIASRIVGNLDLTKISSVAALKKTLTNNIESIVQKRNKAKRDIMSSVQFFADIGRLDNYIDQEITDIYFAELGGTLPSGATTSYKPTPGVTFYDATK